MKKVNFTGRYKNPFSHSARWDSVGIDCEFCQYIKSADWPNKGRDYLCKRHQKSLKIEIGEDGYKIGKWFCAGFKDNGRSHPKSLIEFEQSIFENDKLYCMGWPGEDLYSIEISSLDNG